MVDDTVITRRTREQGFKALVRGSHSMIAWRYFYAVRKLLCDNKVAWRHRLRLLSSCVMSSLYWFSCTWILTQSQCTHLEAIKDKMSRRMIYVPGYSTETSEAHAIRWSKLLHNCRGKHKTLHGDEMYFACCFSWCSHVARLTKADPQRETSRIFMLKNMEWKELGSQCHERRFRCVEMGAGRCTVCWHRLDERGTGSDGLEGQDGCDDQIERTKMADRNASPIE